MHLSLPASSVAMCAYCGRYIAGYTSETSSATHTHTHTRCRHTLRHCLVFTCVSNSDSLSVHVVCLSLHWSVGVPRFLFKVSASTSILPQPLSGIFPEACFHMVSLAITATAFNNRNNTHACAIVFQKRPHPRRYLC